MVSKEKKSSFCVRGGWKNPSVAITVCHHSASLVMPKGDPQDVFFYPVFTLMMYSYNIKRSTDTMYYLCRTYAYKFSVPEPKNWSPSAE